MVAGPSNSRVSVTQRFVSGIKADPWLRHFPASTPNSGNRLFISQGDLDSACGLYCVVMAIMLTTELPRKIAMSLLDESRAQYATFRGLAKSLYFAGSHGQELGELAQALQPGLRYRVLEDRHAEVLAWTLRTVLKGTPVLLAVNDKTMRYSHWVLAIGVEITSSLEDKRSKVPTALLAIDPGSKSPLLRCFNWRLALDQSKPQARYLRFHDDRGRTRLVTCVEAVVFSQAPGTRRRR